VDYCWSGGGYRTFPILQLWEAFGVAASWWVGESPPHAFFS